MNLAINQPSQLSQYARHHFDRSYADQHETLLGHLVCERGQELKSALEDLRPTAKQAHRQTLTARDTCQKIGLAGIAIGVLVGASPMGIAFGLPPLLAGSLALKFWGDSRSELPKRLAEYHTLKIAPNLPEALWAFHLRGLNAAALIGAYDQLIDAIEARMEDGRDFSESEIKEFLQAKIQEAPLTQSDFQPSNDQEASRPKAETLAQTEIQPIAPGAAASPSVQHIVSPVWNPAKDLGENPQSALIVGVPGSGKGMMISNAIRFLKGKHPDLKVFVIDPKASPKERGYWESIADEYHAFSLKNCANPDEGATWLLDCMEAFRRLPGPKLCIFDELMTAATELELADSKMKALPRLKKFVVGLVGQGDSEGEWLWAMTQSPQVKDLGMSGGVRANLRVIGLVSPKNQTAIEALVSTQLIPKPDGGMDELRAIMKASPCGRAVFDGKIARWLPMPVLENHSGFDRDNRSIVAPPSSPPSPSIAVVDVPAAAAVQPTRSRRGRIAIPSRSMPTDTRPNSEQAWEVEPSEIETLDPAIELINEEPNPSKREALMIAYQWARARQDKGDSVDRQTFLERARKDRNCEYLKEHRDEIWDDLQGLLN